MKKHRGAAENTRLSLGKPYAELEGVRTTSSSNSFSLPILQNPHAHNIQFNS